MTANRYRYQNPALLGTVVEFSLDAASDEVADAVSGRLFAEFERLQAVFSAFDDGSELSRWRSGRLPGAETSDEFADLMGRVLLWQRWSGGLFNPLVGELSAVWAEAEADGREPDPGRLSDIASSIAEPRFEMVDGRPETTGDCSRFNLNAVAKGWIVDRALAVTVDQFGWVDGGDGESGVEIGREIDGRIGSEIDGEIDSGIDNMLVNAGGDLCHRGSGTARIGIENPRRPYDNEPPFTVVEIANEAVATSGAGRRAFRVGDRRVSHVLDPRTGQPAEVSASVSIVAPSAMVADVVATPAGILAPTEAIDLVDRPGATPDVAVAALIIDRDGNQHLSRRWRERFGPSTGP